MFTLKSFDLKSLVFTLQRFAKNDMIKDEKMCKSVPKVENMRKCVKVWGRVLKDEKVCKNLMKVEKLC